MRAVKNIPKRVSSNVSKKPLSGMVFRNSSKSNGFLFKNKTQNNIISIPHLSFNNARFSTSKTQNKANLFKLNQTGFLQKKQTLHKLDFSPILKMTSPLNFTRSFVDTTDYGSDQVFKIKNSGTLEATRPKTRALYRHTLRAGPRLIESFALDTAGINRSRFNAMIKEKFTQNAEITHVPTIDRLLLLGAQEVEEAVRHWKTKHHVLQALKPTWIKGKPTEKRGFSPDYDLADLVMMGDINQEDL